MKITYRPEIDGLRAVAVLSVVIYHAKIIFFGNHFLSGGFLGVDIFFVISGYLITSIILKEIKKTKKFSFKNFYQRRIRRIIPALVIVIICSFPFAWFFLMPNDLINFSWSVVSSLTFVSNLFFYFTQEYGAVDSLYKPFIHTWSLAIEEQFYILFPLFLYFFYKVYKNQLLKILTFFFLISFLISEIGSRYFPLSTFYFLHSRMWELLAGSILAYYETILGFKNKNDYCKIVLPPIGMLLILISVFFFNDQTRHPSIITLMIVAGTSLIILFSDNNYFMGKILSSKLFVSTGLLSYSIYLWHYPIFAFSRIATFTQGYIAKKIFLAFLIFLLSIITYYFVERPFRDNKFSFRKVSISLIFSILIIISTCWLFITNEGYKEYRFKNFIFFEENTNLLAERNNYLRNVNSDFIGTKDKKILFVGDSHAQDIFLAFHLNKNLFSKYEFSYLEYDKKIKEIINNQKFKKADIIVFSFRFNEEKFSLVKKIISNIYNKKIILLSKKNEYPYELNYKIKWYKIFSHLTLTDFIYLKINRGEIDKNISKKVINEINKEHYKRRLYEKYSDINSKIEEYSRKNNYLYLKQQDYLCNEAKKICYGITNKGEKIFWDYGHFTLKGAEFFGKEIFKMNWFKIN